MSTMLIPEEHTADAEHQKRRDAEIMAQRWPISLNMRDYIVKTALELAGFKSTDTNEIRPIDGPKPSQSVRLAAMRIVVGYDRLTVQERKLDILEYPTGEPPIPEPTDLRESDAQTAEEGLTLLRLARERRKAEQAAQPKPVAPQPKPEPPPRPIRQRWPINSSIRAAIVTEALAMCGARTTPEGKVERIPRDAKAPTLRKRIVLGALRLLSVIDRISVEWRRVESRFHPPEPVPPMQFDPILEAQLNELMDRSDARIKAERRRREIEEGRVQNV
jgi:hypothetical protein